MSRYTLKTFYGNQLLEKYEHRSCNKLYNILKYFADHPEPGETPFGEPLKHLNRIEIIHHHLEKVFDGNVKEAALFSKTLK